MFQFFWFHLSNERWWFLIQQAQSSWIERIVLDGQGSHVTNIQWMSSGWWWTPFRFWNFRNSSFCSKSMIMRLTQIVPSVFWLRDVLQGLSVSPDNLLSNPQTLSIRQHYPGSTRHIGLRLKTKKNRIEIRKFQKLTVFRQLTQHGNGLRPLLLNHPPELFDRRAFAFRLLLWSLGQDEFSIVRKFEEVGVIEVAHESIPISRKYHSCFRKKWNIEPEKIRRKDWKNCLLVHTDTLITLSSWMSDYSWQLDSIQWTTLSSRCQTSRYFLFLCSVSLYPCLRFLFFLINHSEWIRRDSRKSLWSSELFGDRIYRFGWKVHGARKISTDVSREQQRVLQK